MAYRAYIIILLYTLLTSCSKESVDTPDPDFNPKIEIAEGVEMIYSDSARLKYIIRTPRLEKYQENNILVEKFPEGIRIELYDDKQQLSSTMIANYAENRSSLGTLLLKDDVVLNNDQQDELTTTGIVWNESEQTLTTDKFVRLVKASTQDTLYGFGLEAKDDFSRMVIKDFSGKRRSKED